MWGCHDLCYFESIQSRGVVKLRQLAGVGLRADKFSVWAAIRGSYGFSIMFLRRWNRRFTVKAG